MSTPYTYLQCRYVILGAAEFAEKILHRYLNVLAWDSGEMILLRWNSKRDLVLCRFAERDVWVVKLRLSHHCSMLNFYAFTLVKFNNLKDEAEIGLSLF